MNEQMKQSAWEPGMEISSEAQYHEVTERLAKELLQTHTPEQLAVIAAQHLIYVDVLKQSEAETPRLGLMRAKDRVIPMTEEDLQRAMESVAAGLTADFTEQTTKIVNFALKSYRKYAWGKGGKAKHAETEAQKRDLLAEWDKTSKNYSSQAAFIRHVGRREGVKESTLGTWIREHKKAKG
jgi:hypothetical protein